MPGIMSVPLLTRRCEPVQMMPTSRILEYHGTRVSSVVLLGTFLHSFIAKWISGFYYAGRVYLGTWKFVRTTCERASSVRIDNIQYCNIACVRLYVYPPLANFYFSLALKPFSVGKVTMGAIAELQVDAFSKNTGNVCLKSPVC